MVVLVVSRIRNRRRTVMIPLESSVRPELGRRRGPAECRLGDTVKKLSEKGVSIGLLARPQSPWVRGTVSG